MAEIESYDVLVFGGGKAGKTLAMDQSKSGRRVAMIEVGLIGGSCINIACIPSKALIRSAQVAHDVESASAFGIGIPGGRISIDMGFVRDRTASVVREMVATNQAAFDASGLELVLGWGKFVDRRAIEVETGQGRRLLTADRIFINLGTTATIPATPGLRDANPLTHVEMLTLAELPGHLLVLGGGYIGMELGQAFRRLGSDVTIITRNDRLAPTEDPDASAALLGVMQDSGVHVAFNARDLIVEGRSGERVSVRTGSGDIFEGTHLLVAAGRTPRTKDIGLDIAGVELDENGFIKVDERLRTTAPNIWAMGEVAGSPMFTHASLDDYRVAKSDLTGGNHTTRDRLIPRVMFIDPEYGGIGLNESDARRRGISYRLAKLPMDVVPRARTLSQRQGFMKALVAAETDQILGFSMLGVHAGEVLTAVQMGMIGNLPYTAFRDGIIAHPTIGEGLNMLFANLRLN